MAGGLRASRGELAAALVNYQRAAEQALSRGAVVDAANAMIDAAHVAVQARQPGQAQELVERARLLASSPQLTAEQSGQIIRRIRA
jgi:hypothetical protein